jgi:hypothetical protein
LTFLYSNNSKSTKDNGKISKPKAKLLSKGKRKAKLAQKLPTAKRLKVDEHEETSSKPSSVNLRSGKSTSFLLNYL